MDTIKFEVKFLSVASLARKYDVCQATIWKWCAEGKFPAPRKFGRNSRWLIEDIERWETEDGFLSDDGSKELPKDEKQRTSIKVV